MFLDEAGGVISRGFEGTVSDGVAESAVSGEFVAQRKIVSKNNGPCQR